VTLALVIAGCSDSTIHDTSTSHATSTDQQKLPIPSVTGVAPPTGTTAGGTTVIITGAGFTGATKVVFGTVPATSYKVISDTEISAVSPAQGPSIQNIHVTTAGGTSEPVVALDPFTYVTPASAVTVVAPPTGTTAGGTTVIITGAGFTGATKVVFGTVPATSYKVISDTEISAVSPAEPAGPRNIVVTSAAGAVTPVAAVDQFTYVIPVSVTGVAPPTGTTAGGTTVIITGAGFTGATKVVFGTVPATSYKVISDTEISAVSPAEPAGPRNIVVTSAAGTSTPVTAVDQFTYKA
jgi:hypothetical protein